MTKAEIEFLGPPAGLDESAEYPHPPPGPPEPALWGDTMWVGAFDDDAGIRVVNHIYLTNRGFGRFQSHVWIDGVKLVWGCRAPCRARPDAHQVERRAAELRGRRAVSRRSA